MAANDWPLRLLPVASLQLDEKNPRLLRQNVSRAPGGIIQYMFDRAKALEIADSIATRGFFPNEPLLAVKENGRHVVVEGNRRLAALKALREPELLTGAKQSSVKRLSKRIVDQNEIATVPVTVAPNRRATDAQLAGRHIGTPVLAWEAENRANFILQKLEENYDFEELRDGLGFSMADIENARRTKAIADMARSIKLPSKAQEKFDDPKSKTLTTLERVFDSSVGRDYLMVQRDSNHGFRGNTTKNEFLKGFTKLLIDISLEKQTSR